MSSAPIVVYLDQNKWIDLARAYHNHPEGGEYLPVLEVLREAVSDGRVIIPLSGTHVIETQKVKDTKRRERLAIVMAEFSSGWAVAPAYRIMENEIEISIARMFARTPPEHISVLERKGIFFAVGLGFEIKRIDGRKAKVPEEISELVINNLTSADTTAEVLVGDGLDESLRRQAVSTFEHSSEELTRKIERNRHLQKEVSKALRKRAYAASLIVTMAPTLSLALSSKGLTLQDLLNVGKKRLMSFWENTPIFDCGVELATQSMENYDRAIDKHDQADLMFLSQTIPTCNIIVTERYWCHMVKQCSLDRKYDTIILNDLSQLMQHIG